jgi:hypothetical protein
MDPCNNSSKEQSNQVNSQVWGPVRQIIRNYEEFRY